MDADEVVYELNNDAIEGNQELTMLQGLEKFTPEVQERQQFLQQQIRTAYAYTSYIDIQ